MNLDNLSPLTSAVVGLLIVVGFKTLWFQFRALIHRVLNPPVKEEPVAHWAWCRYGDGFRGHRVRTESIAWDDDDFICDDCLHSRDDELRAM